MSPLGLILLVLLLVLCVGGHPHFGYVSNYGFSSFTGILFLVIFILLVTGRL